MKEIERKWGSTIIVGMVWTKLHSHDHLVEKFFSETSRSIDHFGDALHADNAVGMDLKLAFNKLNLALADIQNILNAKYK